MLNVVYFLWYDPKGRCNHIYTYSAEDVNILRRQVDRHLSVPHEHVCVTDNGAGLDSDIRVVPLDRSRLLPGTRFAKLMVFGPDAGKIGSRMLTLDLDTVVVGELDSLVQRDEPLVLWRNPNFGIPKRARFNTSMMLLSAGCRPDLWNDFDPAKTPGLLRKKWGGTDQAWISEQTSPDNPYWDASHGVYGAGRLGDYKPEQCTTVLPENARVVFFPGKRVPGMASQLERHPWIAEHRV